MSSAFENNQFERIKPFYCHEIFIINYIILTHVIYHIFENVACDTTGFFGNRCSIQF